MSEESKNPFDVDVSADTSNPFNVKIPIEKKNPDSTTEPLPSSEIPTVTVDESGGVHPSGSTPIQTPPPKSWEQDAISKIFPYIQKRINANPNDEDALYQLGRAQLMMKDYNGAINTFTGLTAKNPGQGAYKQGLANALHYAGDKKQAAEMQPEIEQQLGEQYAQMADQLEEERLAGYRARLDASRQIWETLAAPATAPIHTYEAALTAFKNAGTAIMNNDEVTANVQEAKAVIQTVMGGAMSSEGGVVFNALVSAPEMYGVSTEPLMAPLTAGVKATGAYDSMNDNAKELLAIGDLVVVGAAMHKLGKPYSSAKEKPPTKKQLNIAAENLTPEKVTATLDNLDNPEGALLQEQANNLNKEIQNPGLPPQAQALISAKLNEVNQALQENHKNYVEQGLQKVEEGKKAETLQSGIDATTTAEGKQVLQQELEKIDPEIVKAAKERIGEQEIPSESQVEPTAEAGEPVSEPVASNTEDIVPADIKEKGEVVNSILDAEGRLSDGERIFAFHEQDGDLHPIELRSVTDIRKYAPDQLLSYKETVLKPEQDATTKREEPEGDQLEHRGADAQLQKEREAGNEPPTEQKESSRPSRSNRIRESEKVLKLPENLKGQKEALLKEMNAAEEVLLGEKGRVELDKLLAAESHADGKAMTRQKLHETIAPETFYTEDAIERLRDAKFDVDDSGMITFKLPKGEAKVNFKELFGTIRSVEKEFPTSKKTPEGGVRLGRPRDTMKGMEQGRYRSLEEFENDPDFKALQENVAMADKEIEQTSKWVSETDEKSNEGKRAREAKKGAEMRKRIFDSYLQDWNKRHEELKENTEEQWKNLNEAYDHEDKVAAEEQAAREKAEQEEKERKAKKKKGKTQREYSDSSSASKKHGSVKGSFSEEPRMSAPKNPLEEGKELKHIEIPELLQLAKELTGKLPEAIKMGGQKRGYFRPLDELVAVNKKIFNDEGQVAKTLAHEIGHLVDYLPDKTMDRGNLLGRIFSLNDFLKKTFGEKGESMTPKDRASLRSEVEKIYRKELGVKSDHKFDSAQKEEMSKRMEERLQAETKMRGMVRDENIRKELIDVSEYWRPYDKENAPESFKKYRNSAAELYADALSMMFNDPGRLNAMAPEFFQKFFEAIDRKPEVKEAYLNTQDMLNDADLVNEERWKNTLIGFSKGKLKRIEIANKTPDKAKQNLWQRIQRDYISTAVPILNKMKEPGELGITLSEKQKMRNLIEGLKYNENDIWLLNDKVDNEVIKPLELMGLGIDDMGVLGTIERNLKGRENLANPLGIQSSAAKAMHEYAQRKYSPEQWEILQGALQKFHDIVHDVYKEAHEAGMFTDETWNDVIEKNKDNYLTYQVADYIDKQYVSGRIIQAKGTFKEIENPVVSTMLKTISLIKATNRQLAINEFSRIWKRDFPDEIKESAVQRGKGGDIIGFKDREGHGRIEYYQNGKWSGMDVDPTIAEIFEKYKPQDIGVIMKALSWANSKWKPLVTTYNLGFAYYSNIMRDNPRAFKNIMTIMMSNPSTRSFKNAITYIPEYLSTYVKSLKHSAKYAKGDLTDLTREMLEQKSLSATSFYFNDFDPNANENVNAVHRKYNFMYKNLGLREKPFDRFLDKYGPTRAFNKFLNGMQYGAAVFEYNTKITGYQILKKKLRNAEAAGFYTRNYVGTPNFLEKGVHTRVMNDVFIFSNVILQGLRADAQLATRPSTRGAYWMTHGITTLVPSMVMGAAMYGLFGDDIKKMYAGIPEYMKTNYYCVPLGVSSEGKTVYWTLPMDDVSRMIHAITIKGNEAAAGDLKQPEQIVRLPLSMLPNEATPIKVVSAWTQYLNGQNPKDDLYGRDIINDKNFTAGGYYALEDMGKWTLNNAGVHIPFYDPTRETGTEYLINNLPLFRRMIRESNSGVKERLDAAGSEVTKERARTLIAQDDVIKKVLSKAKSENASADDLEEYNQQLSDEYFGDKELDKDEQTDLKRMQKHLRNYILTGSSSPFSQVTSAIINSTSDDQKIAKLQAYKESVGESEFQELINYLIDEKLIDKKVINALEEGE